VSFFESVILDVIHHIACASVLYETLRLFPPAPNIPKTSAIDTTITASNEAGENVILPVPKGTVLVLHAPGLHYNRAPSLLSFCHRESLIGLI
jgi:hypothetical protein